MFDVPTLSVADAQRALPWFLAFAGLFVGSAFLQRGRLPYHSAGTLLTRTELAFYKVLDEVAGQHFKVLFKVRLGDVVRCSDALWNRGFGHKIATQHIDFVLVDHQSARIRLCIELDDPSHNTRRGQRRDRWKNAVLHKAGVRLARIKTRNHYDPEKMRRWIWANVKSKPQEAKSNDS